MPTSGRGTTYASRNILAHTGHKYRSIVWAWGSNSLGCTSLVKPGADFTTYGVKKTVGLAHSSIKSPITEEGGGKGGLEGHTRKKTLSQDGED